MVAEQLASGGKTSMFVSAPYPPLMISPAKGKLIDIQERMKDFHWRMLKDVVLRIQIKITSWAIVSLADVCLDKVREVNRKGEMEKNLTNHLQQADLAQSISFEVHCCYKGDNF